MEPYVNAHTEAVFGPRQPCVYTAAPLLLLAPLIYKTFMDLGLICHKEFESQPSCTAPDQTLATAPLLPFLQASQVQAATLTLFII